ncbi:probable G-protein coupled receptor 34 [Scophthalmus maximus]|uniref:probable G-protein coupled receptor 34 n=1 Tax=Scophthalmus maximus TaxID=52904 RepID=UPI0015E089B1|nr:probable G-protein coupled receptor 34 [Scophthalmus maximus]XP_035459541.1 probable G-protein coupled receptor 34 [Scophthalmus maximus]XP_047193125.1 probable G-protein coupled receptor 34 [Scophthalmus maximus]
MRIRNTTTTASSQFISEMNWTSTPEPDCVDYDALQVPLAVLYCLIFVLGLVGNSVALLVFLCVHSKKNSVRVFLINIACADLLLVACLPFRVLYHSRGNVWNLDPTLCKVVGNLFYVNMYISITLLGLISVDRYLKIHRGAGPRLRLPSSRWSSVVCAVVWIASFALASVLLMSGSDSQSNRCFHYKTLRGAEWKAHINMSVLVIFWLVFICLLVSYGRIALRLLRASRDKPDLPNAARYARTARKSLFVLVLFTVCFVPYHVVRVFYIKTQITDTPCYWRGVVDTANEVALLFSALNSCLDPVMYFLLSSSMRKEVLRLVGNVFRVRDFAGVSGSSSTVERTD